MDISWKASRVYRNAESSLFEVNELRHIIEPEIDYGYIPAPNRSPSQLPQFDYTYPGLRLQPIEFPENNSIDSIGRQNVLRFMLINKLQTKRFDGIEDLFNWDIYTDWNLTRGTNFAFSDVYSDLDFRPRSWITFNSSTRYDLADSRWREAIERIIARPHDRFEFIARLLLFDEQRSRVSKYLRANISGAQLDFLRYVLPDE